MMIKSIARLFPILIFLVSSMGYAGAKPPAIDDIKTSTVNYEVNGQQLTGFYAYDANQTGKRPGVLVVHEWWGQNEYARTRAIDLAKAGYAAFALDMYGEGKTTDHPKQATDFMMATFAKASIVPDRFDAAYNWLQKQPEVNADDIAAIGFCYGGGVVLGMARAGKDLDAVVSFHGSLETQTPAQPGQVKAKVAVYTGADDPMVPPEQVTAFEQEMKNANVDYTLKSYPDTVHSFTNPGATEAGLKNEMPLAYNPEAAADAWQGMLDLFDEVFK